MAEQTDHIEDTPTAEELKVFAKTDFYQGWKKRFDKLANLGATGVIATPNTTFDEWLYYFKQWSELYATDYQSFKDMADDAVRSLNDGYKQNKEDYKTMADNIQTGFENTSQTMKDIMGDVANLKNQVNNLESNTQPNADLKIGLIKETQDRIAGDNNLQAQINTTKTEITDTLSNIKLTPEYFETLDALKAAYPNGFNGLAVAGVNGVMHSFVYRNSTWVDFGVYSQTAVNSKVYFANEKVDLDNLRNEYSVLTNLNNVTPIPEDLQYGKASNGAFVFTQTASTTETGVPFFGTQIMFSVVYPGNKTGKIYMRKHWGNPAAWNAWENVSDKYFKNILYDEVAPAINLDDLSNGLYTIPNFTNVSPLPSSVPNGNYGIIVTMLTPNDDNNAVGYQLLYDVVTNAAYKRYRWGANHRWRKWHIVNQNNVLYPVNTAVDLNDLNDEYVILSNTYNVSNLPDNWSSTSNGAIVNSKIIDSDYNDNFYGMQSLINVNSGKIYYRFKWGSTPVFHEWTALNNIESPGYAWASMALFEKVGVVGDSYASGEIGTFDSSGHYRGQDHYNISWPQIIARKNGIDVYNYTAGGLTAQTWLNRTDERGATQLASDPAKNLYLINLGINDKSHAASQPLGSSDDIGQDVNSFYANYGKIVKMIKDHAPKAKIICLGVTLGGYDAYDKAISEVANYYGVRFIKTSDYVFFTSNYFTGHMSGSHPTAEVYSGMANAIQHLVEKDMTENHGYYYNAGF